MTPAGKRCLPVKVTMLCQSHRVLLLVVALMMAAAAPSRAEAAPDGSSGPLLEVPENLRRKPGDGMKQEILLHRNLTNVAKHLDESLELFCDIVGTPVPTYQWLKDEAQIPNNHERVRTKVTLYGAELTIDQLTESDSGWYSCVATNTAGTKKTSGYVTVKPTRRKKKNKKKRPKDDEGSDTEGTSGSAGFCQAFKMTVCSSFLTSQDVYVPSNVYQYNMESQFLKRKWLPLKSNKSGN